MGIIQKDALRTTLISYIGLIVGYLNKGFLFIIILSTEEIGLINLILAVGILFAQFTNLGSIYSIWRFYPFFKNEKNNDYGFLVFNLLVVLTGIGLFSFIFILFKEQISSFYELKSALFIKFYYYVLPVGIGFGFYLLFDNYLRSLFKNTISVFVNDIGLRILTTILIGLYYFNVIPFRHFVLLISLSYFLPPIVLFVYLKYIGEGDFSLKSIRISKKFKKIIYSYSLYSYVNSMGAIVVITLDTVMIASILGLKETGIYTTILYLTSVLSIPYRSLLRVSNPIITEYWKSKNMSKMNELYKRMSSVTLVLGLFMFFGIWINRIELFSFLPSDFQSGVNVFLFLMIGKLFDMYMGLNGTIFVTSNKYKYDLIFTLSLMATVLVLNLILIPKWGISGAAISTTIALVGYNLARLIFVWISFKINPFRLSQLFVILLFGGIGLMFEMYHFSFDNRIITIFVNSGVYTLLVFIPIFTLNIEPEVVNYGVKIKKYILKK